ncbi:MAG: protein kinase [Acidobacteriota bacterium]
MIGRTIGNFRIVERLGAGGMGTVYKAIDEMVHREVAIKVLKAHLDSDPAMQERFRTEARALANLNHPAICILYSFFTADGENFMVMEYVSGRNLEQALKADGPMSWMQAGDVILRVLEGLQHAHTQGVIHRDLKPANIMLSAAGEVKITDFGIARMFSTPRLTGERSVIGTIEYLAPERLLGQDATQRSDLYSLGIVLYEMLSGRPPFVYPKDSGSNEYQLIRMQVEDLPQPLEALGIQIPEGMERMLLAVLAKDPNARPSDAASFALALRRSMLDSGLEAMSLPDLRWARKVKAKASGQILDDNTIGDVTLGPVPSPVRNVPVRDLGLDRPPVPVTKPGSGPLPLVVEPTASPATPTLSQRFGPHLPKLAFGGIALVALALIEFWMHPGVLQPKQTTQAPVPVQPPLGQTPETPGVAPPVPSQPVAVTPPPAVPNAPVPGDGPQPKAISPNEPIPPPELSKEPPVDSPVKTAGDTSVKTLASVRHIYIAPAPDKFDAVLRKELTDEFKGTLDFSGTLAAADAVMSITLLDEKGHRASGAAGKRSGLKGAQHAVATLRDPAGKVQLWIAEVDDRTGFGFGDKTKRLASRLASRLHKDIGN